MAEYEKSFVGILHLVDNFGEIFFAFALAELAGYVVHFGTALARAHQAGFRGRTEPLSRQCKHADGRHHPLPHPFPLGPSPHGMWHSPIQ